MKRVLQEEHNGTVILVKQSKDIQNVDGLIIPGGESTTIARILHSSGMYRTIKQRMAHQDIALMGTCAGCVLLAKELYDIKPEIPLLQAMDMQVARNAFGRQLHSHERDVVIKGFTSPFHAVFIRAPEIKKIWGSCEVLATVEQKIVMARQNRYLALSFHPELTDDLRIHHSFFEML